MTKLALPALLGSSLLLSGCISGDWSLFLAGDTGEICRSDGELDVCQRGGEIRVTDYGAGAAQRSDEDLADRAYDLIDVAQLPTAVPTPGFSLGRTDLTSCSVGAAVIDGNKALLTCRLTMMVQLD